MNDLARIDHGVQSPALFSVEEFQQLCDTGIFQGSKVELVEGMVVRMSPAMSRHMVIQRQLAFDLHAIFGNGVNEWVATFEASVQFAAQTLRDLDVAIVRRLAESETYLDPANVLLAAEVSSTTLRYDLNDKLVEYARGGIPHYWVVDVTGEWVHVMSDPIDGDYTARRRVAFGEPLAVPGCDATVTIR
jgi:Uma2 family endonuclease